MKIDLRQTAKDTLASVMFLSRLPLPAQFRSNELPDFGKTAYTYPLAGLILAFPAALIAAVGSVSSLSLWVVSFLVVGTMVATTGALHEDGLADVADGFWGGHTKARKLEIMRDSTIGTYGVLALIFVFGTKVALLADLFASGDWVFAAVLVLAMTSFSRTAMLVPWSMLPPARPQSDKKQTAGKQESGLSIRYGAPTFSSTVLASLMSMPLVTALYFAGFSVISILLGVVIMKFFIVGSMALARHHIGGHTGDTLGATQQISELGLLLGLAIAT